MGDVFGSPSQKYYNISRSIIILGACEWKQRHVCIRTAENASVGDQARLRARAHSGSPQALGAWKLREQGKAFRHFERWLKTRAGIMAVRFQ